MDSEAASLILEQICEEGERKRTLNLGRATDESERRFIIGRAPECDLCLVSTQYPSFISRQHARISLGQKKIFVADLKSMNGTLVNDIMLQPMFNTKVTVGDSITFGCISPETEILPGNTVGQENPVFKFILKKTQDSSEKYEEQAEQDKIVPLTVSNLIAYSGCSFSSDDKENSDCPKKPKEKRRRRRTLFYSKRRRPNPSADSCEFSKCKISQIDPNSVVSWVQCDVCDKWFHTHCIGCDYDSVRSDKAKFHCGQC